MNKFTEGLAGLIFALGAGCASQKAAQEVKAPEITHEYLSQVEQRVLAIDQDGKRTGSEAAEISTLYAIVSANKPAKDADASTKEHYDHVVKMLTGAQKDNYKNMKFNLVLTGVDTKEFGNVPGNIGGTKPLEQVTGEQIVNVLGEQRGYELMSKIVPVEQYTGCAVTRGTVQAGGGRLVGMDKAYEITLSEAKKIVGNGLGRITKEAYKNMTDGNKDNGEMSRAYLFAETCRGYDLPKPAVKK